MTDPLERAEQDTLGGCGGTGRRAALRSLWEIIPWRFKSSQPHHRLLSFFRENRRAPGRCDVREERDYHPDFHVGPCAAAVAELVDALASGASDRMVVEVQVLSAAPSPVVALYNGGQEKKRSLADRFSFLAGTVNGRHLLAALQHLVGSGWWKAGRGKRGLTLSRTEAKTSVLPSWRFAGFRRCGCGGIGRRASFRC